ncbi:MAG: serine/threonine protein kinase [Acidobacteriota bacterium]|nr:serine/threonine protein kinase [Acidobacteriota bacterium]
MAEALTKAGRYQIVGELGRGSMGVVYQGFDPIIGRTVAIKTMLPEGLSPQEFQEYKARFQREAMAAGILAHPNIITVYDFGEDNGVLYLAMEYLEGKSLEKIVQEQTILPIETILPIYDQVCSALDNAHRNKIVHRDVKPANIMILQNGLVKVTDFGIAKMMSMGMTQAGQILGTPNYMSPEQVKGRQIDGRSDIFSLGVILYELVTGEKPFGGQNITTVIYKIINENPIPPRELDASIHAGLSHVINKALAKNVDERYQTCQELAEDLRNYKNLGGSAVGHGTVLMNASPGPAGAAGTVLRGQPLAAPPAPPTALDETPIGSSLDVPVVPPPGPTPQPQAIPQIAWVVGALLLVAIMAGASYFFLRPRSQPVTSAVPAQVATVTPAQSPQPPAASAAPATAAAAPKPSEAAPKAGLVSNPEPRPHAAGAKVGQLMVSANVNGARISVDGRSDPDWVTPHTIPDLPSGAHNIVVSMNGYDDFRQSVTIEGGQTGSVVASLSSPSAEFGVVTVPAGVEVLIDGKSYGLSPVRATLPPGNHTYTIKQPGAPPFENTVTLKSSDIITRKVTLSAAAKTGIAEVRSIPTGASVLADGAPVGGQTPTSFRLSVGTHTLVISLSGYRPIQRQITVSENETAPVNVTLTSQ